MNDLSFDGCCSPFYAATAAGLTAGDIARLSIIRREKPWQLRCKCELKAMSMFYLVSVVLIVGSVGLVIFGLAYWRFESKTKKSPPNKQNKPKSKYEV
jgi:hypothetical protein